MQCAIAYWPDLSDQGDIQITHTFHLVNLVLAHLGSLRDSSHVLLLSLDDLAQDKNICRVTSSDKKKYLIHYYSRSHYLVIF